MIVIIIILAIIIFYIYNNFFYDIDTTDEIIIGVHSTSKCDDKTIIVKELLNFKLEKYNYTIKYYKKDKNMLTDLNNNTIQFCLGFEDTVIDSIIGLNSYKNNKLENLRFVNGLYYYHFYFVSAIFYKDIGKTVPIKTIEDLKDFYNIYKRNPIIGTEEKNSISSNNLIMLLYMYGFKPIDINKKKKDDDDNDKIVYYYNTEIGYLRDYFIENKLDAIFLVKHDEYKVLKYIADKKDVIFFDLTFNETFFNELFSLYYYTKKIKISGLEDSIDTQHIFETKSSRLMLINNKYTPDDITEILIDSYFTHNNLIINLLLNKNSIENHNLFEPIDMIHINKHIPIHHTAYNYYKKMGYIIDKKLKQKLDNKKVINSNNLSHYWKYKKIGLNKFVL